MFKINVLIPSIRSISHNYQKFVEGDPLPVLIPSIRSISHNVANFENVSNVNLKGLNPFYQVHFS